MDALPPPPLFDDADAPADAFRPQSAVVPVGGMFPSLTRDDACEPPPAADALLFSLFSVDVRHGVDVRGVGVNVVDPAITCSETALRAVQRARAAAREVAEAEHKAANEHMKWPPRFPAPPMAVFLTGQLVGGRKVGFSITTFQPHCFVEAPHSTRTYEEAEALFKLATQRLRLSLSLVPTTRIFTASHFGRFEPILHGPGAGTQRAQFYFLRLALPTHEALRRAARMLREGFRATAHMSAVPALEIHEDNIDVDQKFVDAAGLQPCGWHSVPRRALRAVTPSVRCMLTSEEYELAASPSHASSPFRTDVHIKPLDADAPLSKTMATLHIASLDCEMNSGAATRFPAARRADNPVVVVGVVFAYAGTVPARLAALGVRQYQEYERHVFVLSRHCAPIPGVIVHLFDDEGELLAAVRDELFVRKQIDVLLGHNLVNFDVKYMAERVARFGSSSARRFLRFGALLLESLRLKEKKLGSNTLTTLPGAGFAYVDTMLTSKALHRLRDYSLSTVAAAFLPAGVSKLDMPYELIPEAVRGGPDAWAKLAAYCVQDCRLPLMLVAKWQTLQDLNAQSRIINIPMAVNTQCGQQVRVRNTVMNRAHGAPFFMVCSGVDEPKDVIAARKAARAAARVTARAAAAEARKRAREDADAESAAAGAGAGAGAPTPDDEDDVDGDVDVDIHVDNDHDDGGAKKRRRVDDADADADADAADEADGGDDGDYTSDEDGVAEGGSVFPTVPGVHSSAPVVVLDFASLYPTVQQACGLSYDTHLAGRVTDARVAELRRAGYTVDVYNTSTGQFAFVSNIEGVYPAVLAGLREQRTRYKNAMEVAQQARDDAGVAGDASAEAEAAAAYANANASQASTKIVMNSGYGAANARDGKMPCVAFGTTTCYVGARVNRLVASFVCGPLGTFPVPNEDLRAKGIALAMLEEPCLGARLLYGDTDSIMVEVPLPPELAAHGTPRDKLAYAFEWGKNIAQRINKLINFKMFKTEFEKVYYPFLLSTAKKQYAGIKYEPHQCVDAMRPTLGRPDKALRIDGGRIEMKGMKSVRRDSAAFVKRMTLEMFDALLYDGDEDAFWRVVHRYTRDLAYGRLPLDDFVVTAELKDNYALQAAVTPQAAVSYHREYEASGSACPEGTRVPFVHVEEPDTQRLNVPPRLVSEAVAAAASRGSGSTHVDLEAVFDGIQRDLGDAPAFAYKYGSKNGSKSASASASAAVVAKPASASASASARKASGEVKLAAYARHPDEVLRQPERNHVDYLRYHMLGIDAVLKQVMPHHDKARLDLALYAKEAAQIRRTVRARGESKRGTLFAFVASKADTTTEAAAGDTDAASTTLEKELDARLRPLSFCKPACVDGASSTIAKQSSLTRFIAGCSSGDASSSAAAVTKAPPSALNVKPARLTARERREAQKAKRGGAVHGAASSASASSSASLLKYFGAQT